MSQLSLLAFFTVSLIAIATPGPTVLLALANGSRFGLRAAALGMLGAALSDLVLIAASALGLGSLLAASSDLFTFIKWIGVVYLAFLGVMMLRGAGKAVARVQPDAASDGGLFFKSFLVAVTNPKGYMFFAALLPQFVQPDLPQLPQYAILAAIFVGTDLMVMLAYAVCGSYAGRTLKEQGAAWMQRLCGGTLLALAGMLAFYKRASN